MSQIEAQPQWKETKINAIEMKRQIQAQFYEDTQNMSPEELITYVRQRIAAGPFKDFLNQVEVSVTTTDDTSK